MNAKSEPLTVKCLPIYSCYDCKHYREDYKEPGDDRGWAFCDLKKRVFSREDDEPNIPEWCELKDAREDQR